ncbi:site-specific integrase [Leifsonia sp. H3M29-4]|uniref:tyrosine-type recombinase/integrase n=1 Tax=Salinibacterium metalliresistens TaxID=3031321 RepID=UPI0023D9F7A6|nr:site-specific integrase [Salinibacterium metalliresistens]MDF1479958.1 site-specific integrase [Salinibacterium metalliresistens]HOY81021.1 site-specific integrase [Rhodoglobus sp.]
MVERDDNVILFAPFGGAAPDPELFLAGVLDGWERQQRSKDFSAGTIRTRRALVLNLVDFSGRYPWEWTFADVDDFFAHARGVRNLSHSTVRSYQTSIKLFCDYACDPRYDWNEQSGRLFGQLFSQVVTEFNRVTHSQPSEARPAKRPFTPRELQELFDLADLEVTRILDSGRRSPVAAWRDAVAFKTAYGWGLRSNELRHLQLVDLSSNHRAPYFGEYGVLRVRWGKPHRGSAKKVRSVLTVWEWSAQVLRDWVENGLPIFGQPINDLFPTSGGAVVGESHLLDRLRGYIDELGFPPGLDLHSFRRAYATNLITGEGFDVSFVQMQLGHEHASTTSIYSIPSPDYQTRALQQAHERTLAAAKQLPRRREP